MKVQKCKIKILAVGTGLRSRQLGHHGVDYFHSCTCHANSVIHVGVVSWEHLCCQELLIQIDRFFVLPGAIASPMTIIFSTPVQISQDCLIFCTNIPMVTINLNIYTSIWPKVFVGPHMILGNVYGWLDLKKIASKNFDFFINDENNKKATNKSQNQTWVRSVLEALV